MNKYDGTIKLDTSKKVDDFTHAGSVLEKINLNLKKIFVAIITALSSHTE